MVKGKEAFELILSSVDGIVKEYTFHPTRKWRFDFYYPPTKIAYEFEGIIANKSRHTTITGYTNDCEKYNEATKMGIKVYRFTTINIHTLEQYLPSVTKIF